MTIRTFLVAIAVSTCFCAFAQISPSPHTFSFPPVSLQTGQTAEVDVANVASNGTTTNASCNVAVSFVNASGAVITPPGAVSNTALGAGQIFSAKLAGTGSAIRAVVTMNPATGGQRPPCSLQFSFQTYDGSGTTHVFLSATDQVFGPVFGPRN